MGSCHIDRKASSKCRLANDNSTTSTASGNLVEAVAEIFGRTVVDYRIDARVEVGEALREDGHGCVIAEDAQEVAAEDVDVYG